MVLATFLHTLCRVLQTGRVHFIHYHCSVAPVDAGRVHHHDMLPRLTCEPLALEIPTPLSPDQWTMPAVDWSVFFTLKEKPLLMPGQHTTFLERPMATPRKSRQERVR